MTVMHNLLISFNCCKQVDVAILDFSKAFEKSRMVTSSDQLVCSSWRRWGSCGWSSVVWSYRRILYGCQSSLSKGWDHDCTHFSAQPQKDLTNPQWSGGQITDLYKCFCNDYLTLNLLPSLISCFPLEQPQVKLRLLHAMIAPDIC